MNKKYIIFDIETDGLNATEIHVLSYIEDNKIKSLYDYENIKEFIEREDIILVGHNIISYDLPVLKKLLNLEPKNTPIDTLTLSKYLLSYRKGMKHGLEYYGKYFNIPKIKVDKWDTDDIELYTKRCERDVEINYKLWKSQLALLKKLYPNPDHLNYVFEYFYYKSLHLSINEKTGIFLDKYNAVKYYHLANFLLAKKEAQLLKFMPKDLGKIEQKRPLKMYKKDGSVSAIGLKWIKKLQDLNLPEDTEIIYERPNPGSHKQVKEWLNRLGWKPDIFKENDKGELIPQINKPFGQGLADSIIDMFDNFPYLKHLDSYYKIRHRSGILKSFIEHEKDGKIYMRSFAFTKTLRLAHSAPIVNLPKPGLFFGDEIRGVLYAPKGYILIGADLKSLEDRTKQHYLYPLDPEYVNAMQVPGFDPHIDISKLAGLMTEDDEEFFKNFENIKNPTDEEKIRYKKIKKARGSGKTVNFAATYGAGIKKLKETMKSTYEFAKKLYNIYWKRNWAIKEISKTFKIKKVGKIKWIFNPVSKLWLPITAEKDSFSAANQSLGVFVFDTWVKHILKIEPNSPIWLQYHDEIGLIIEDKPEIIEKYVKILKEAITRTNKELKLNVEMNIDIQIGKNYKEIH